MSYFLVVVRKNVKDWLSVEGLKDIVLLITIPD